LRHRRDQADGGKDGTGTIISAISVKIPAGKAMAEGFRRDLIT